jgi:hypothetical protein
MQPHAGRLLPQRSPQILVKQLIMSAKRICGESIVNLVGHLPQKNVSNPTNISP